MPEQIDWNSATLHVRRVKSGKPSTHPIRGDELRALRKLQREAPKSPFVFVSERGGPFITDSFNWMIKRAGQKTSIPFQVHSHMLRHAAGYKLAGDGHALAKYVMGAAKIGQATFPIVSRTGICYE